MDIKFTTSHAYSHTPPALRYNWPQLILLYAQKKYQKVRKNNTYFEMLQKYTQLPILNNSVNLERTTPLFIARTVRRG